MTLKESCVAVVLAASVLVIAFGFWLAWHPLGFIVGGLLAGVFTVLVGIDVPKREAK